MPNSKDRPQPSVTHLSHRLANTPAEYLGEPKIGGEPGIHVDAIVADLIVKLGGKLPRRVDLEGFRTNTHLHRDHHRLVMVGAWLLADHSFLQCWEGSGDELAKRALTWFQEDLVELANVIFADDFISDPERREELSRRAIDALGMVPEGESEADASDRLTMLDSVERQRLLLRTEERVKRAEELRRKMNAKRAREAAARYTRE